MTATQNMVRADVASMPPTPVPTRRDFEQLWVVLAPLEWSSVVVVPADPDGSAAEIVMALAEVGNKVGGLPVTPMAVKTLEPGSAGALAELARYVSRDIQRRLEATPGVIDVPASHVDDSPSRAQPDESAPQIQGMGRLLIAIPSLLSEPLGLAVAHAATAVVISIQRGRTTMTDVRRTLELVGRERVAGCVLSS